MDAIRKRAVQYLYIYIYIYIYLAPYTVY